MNRSIRTDPQRPWITALRRGDWGWLLVPFIAVPAIWPFYAYGLPLGHDIPNHLMRLVIFEQQLRNGLLYPRWVPELALGYGYPLWNFYGPGTYYLSWIFLQLGFDHADAFAGASSLLVLIAGWGMWCFARDVFDEQGASTRCWAARVAAVAYIYAPYVIINMFIRGAIAELGAQALLPWILLGFRRLVRAEHPQKWVLPIAFGLAGVAVSHSISLLLLPPFILAYLAILLLGVPRDRRLSLAGWAAVAGIAAIGLSAFFWLPLVVERQELGTGSYAVARQWISEKKHFWSWATAIQSSLIYRHPMDPPFQLGLTQTLLALAGFFLARRQDSEWRFFGVAALLAGFLMLETAQPFWQSARELTIIQFPWRSLTFISLAFALFVPGLLTRLRDSRWQGMATVSLIGVIIWTQRPQLEWMRYLPPDAGDVNLPAVNQFEFDTHSWGATTNYRQGSDFIPRWVDLSYGLQARPHPSEMLPTEGVSLTLRSASSTEWVMQINASQSTRLRFASFNFTGWRAWLDRRSELPLYPSTPLGLLTVDIPQGASVLHVAWQGSRVQWAGAAVSWMALAALAFWQWFFVRPRWPAALTGLILIASGMVALYRPPRPTPITLPPTPVEMEGLELLGYRTQLRSHFLDLYPYWFVRRPTEDLEFHWQLTDPRGNIITQAQARPYFDTLPTYSWRTGTIMDDVYQLALPSNLPADAYSLHVCAQPFTEVPTTCTHFFNVGTLSLPAASEMPPTLHYEPLNLNFSDKLSLTGYTLKRGRRPITPDQGGEPIVHPDDNLYFTLYWRGRQIISVNYHGFVHLINANNDNIVGSDHTLGSFYYPPRLWDTFYLKSDAYPLRIPPDAPSGLYWPLIGVYQFETRASLPVASTEGQPLGDSVTLPPVKILNPPRAHPQHALSVKFADFAQLLGYDLAAPAAGLHPGETFTLTLYYRASAPAPADYTQFVHVSADSLGLAAQTDAQPQSGINPTSAWVPGEVIADTLVLNVSPTATSGKYQLSMGFYDPLANGERVPAHDRQGAPFLDNAVVLTELQIVK